MQFMKCFVLDKVFVVSMIQTCKWESEKRLSLLATWNTMASEELFPVSVPCDVAMSVKGFPLNVRVHYKSTVRGWYNCY